MSDIKKDNLKYSLSYIPLVAFFFLFVEKDISKDFKKHINYWMILFWVYVVLSIVLNALMLSIFIPILFVAYLWASIVLGYKVYNWDDVQVEILDNIEIKIKDNFDKK